MEKMSILVIALVTLLAACANASIPTEEPASNIDIAATTIAEIVSATQTAMAIVEPSPTETTTLITLNDDYENAVPILSQLITGIYLLEGSNQAVTSAQAQELLSLLTSLPNGNEQFDALVTQAILVLSQKQITTITAMQITQSEIMTVMQELGISMGGPDQGKGTPPDGEIGQPPQGDMPQGAPPDGQGPQGGAPPSDSQAGTPPQDGIQQSAEIIPPNLLNSIIELLQVKLAS